MACHTRAYFPPHHFLAVWAFRDTISLQLSVQSRHLFSVTMFRVVLLKLTFKAFISFSLAFKAAISSRFRRSEPLSSQFGHSKPLFLLSFGIQSHHIFSVWAFRATISSQFGHSEPPSLLSSSVQSHYLFLVSTFKATIFSVWPFRPAISS